VGSDPVAPPLNGYMADYLVALRIVRRANSNGERPLFASLF
jgi:hypothetical protein